MPTILSITGLPYEVPGEIGATSSFCIRYFTGINVNKDILINGDNNFIHGSSSNLNIFGNNNDLGFATKNISVHGNNNIITDGLEDVFIIGNNVTATQSNTNIIGSDFSFEGDLQIAPGRYIYSGEIGANSIGFDIGGRLLIEAPFVSIGSIDGEVDLFGKINIGNLSIIRLSQVSSFPVGLTNLLTIAGNISGRPIIFKIFIRMWVPFLDIAASREDVYQLRYDGANYVVEDQVNLFETQTNPGTPVTSLISVTSTGTDIFIGIDNTDGSTINLAGSVQQL